MSSSKCFRSIIAIDVKVTEELITILDSSKMAWHVDPRDCIVLNEFKKWLVSSFLKGKSQTLTTFEYEERIGDPDVVRYIVKFTNISE
nr:MAG TPA: hypothetical protein [Caudoviricetes sp.]